MLNLDTHILIFALTGELSPAEEKILFNHRWSISSIVLWEIAKLRQKEKINLDLNDSEIAHYVSRIHCWPIDIEICRHISRIDVHVDPADEIIMATSIAKGCPLLTRDKRIKKSKLIKCLT